MILVVGIVTLIVRTLDAEVERGHVRMASDTMSHLASQLYLGLEEQVITSLESLSLPYLGPGEAPREVASSTAAPSALSQLLPADAYLPADPWGRSYLLVPGIDNGHDVLFLVCAGPKDRMPERLDPSADMVQRVHLPPQP